MKSIFTLIILLYSILGVSQNSELIVLSENDTLKSSDFDFWIKTKDDFLKFNDSNKLLYDNLILENNDIVSLLFISENDTLNFKLDKRQFWTFKKENSEYKSLSLTVGHNGKSEESFDFNYHKKNKTNLLINIADQDFSKMLSEFTIGLEKPNGKYDEEFISKYKIRQINKKFRKRKKELKKHFKETDFITLAFGNSIIFEQITKANNSYK
ncbi:hypothetical protein [Patiriisocius hiemis]|uniref:Uncharacterized protein n=1 Tax=Patiriisocius hiemis TaxID=3075604 RepID=A0ABU2YB29_9FLAO|nr:hypothetical protein [Constantimarinum sp. W242]MDT0555399.1 hypothetical protein [Constantimarinum sp. W242]